MTQNDKNLVSAQDQDSVFTPGDDLQIVMQGGLPVSVIVPMEEFDRMTATMALAEQLLEGQQFDLADGKKGSFQQLADERVALERAEYEAELAAMFEDDCDEQSCDEQDSSN